MDDPKTQDLLSSLNNTDIDTHLKLIDGKYPLTIQAYFNEIIAKRQLKAADIIRKSGQSDNYMHQVLNGTKTKPSRDKLIALCIGAELNLEETQRALEIGKVGILYAKSKRDSVMIYAINNKLKMRDVNGLLEKYGAATIE